MQEVNRSIFIVYIINMQRNLNHLLGWNLAATDGEIGKVVDFYFDDEKWTIRYLIVRTGSWLSEREVLISPDVLLSYSWESGLFLVRLTKEQVRHSPDIDTDRPVSRQQEAALARYYPWQNYWGSSFYPSGVWGVIPATPVIDPGMVAREAEEAESTLISHEDHHLRSAQKVKGYHIHASDGDIGHVEDFILDDQTWQISYLLVDTHNWIGGKKVMVAVRHIKEVQWTDSKVVVDISVDTIKGSLPADKMDSKTIA
jgi:sporulation protein YlmC with PRC-barrel domain